MATYLGKLKGKYVENRNNLHFKGGEQEDNLKLHNINVLICKI